MRNLTAQSGNSDLALLGALCLFLSAVDHLIPKPLPFMRIGLANLPLLLALGIFPAGKFFLLALVKVLGQALITGTFFSYVLLFSLAGTALSAVTMIALYRITSLVGTSIAGAFVSNAAQLIIARFIVFGEGVLYLTPPFLIAGIVSGGLLGFFAEAFSANSEWLRRKRNRVPEPAGAVEETGIAGINCDLSPDSKAVFSKTEKLKKKRTIIFFRRLALLIMAAVFLFVPYLPIRAALFLVFWVLAIAAGKKTRPLLTLISFVIITVCNLFPPFGKIIFRAGPFLIAEGSLLRGLQRAVTMEGLIMFSAFALLSVPPLPGKFGKLLRESFGILEHMNTSFFGGKNKTEKTGSIIKKLDKLLCEISGYTK